MTAAIAYALTATVFIGLTDFIFKQAARGAFKTHQFLWLQSVTFATLVWLYAWFTSQIVFSAVATWGLVAGCFMFTGFYCFALSLKHGSVSINAPIFRLNLIVTAALAVLLLDEPVTPAKLAGLALALGAIWLLLGSVAPDARSTAADIRRSLALVAIATLAVGVGSIIHKIGMNQGAPPALLLALHSSVYLVLATIVAVRADGGLRIPAAVLPYSIGGAVIGAVAFIAFVEALARGEASIVVPIAQMGFVVTAVLGVLVLGEPLTARKTTGLAMAIAALWLLSRA